MTTLTTHPLPLKHKEEGSNYEEGQKKRKKIKPLKQYICKNRTAGKPVVLTCPSGSCDYLPRAFYFKLDGLDLESSKLVQYDWGPLTTVLPNAVSTLERVGSTRSPRHE
ncbi:hypothetical protein EVAR_92388_1 [Eumeta japonica]|uniref:Uncharacterized protein n=1 Tax=Eumeta variegata TaxID=151549 RepID=A0A4C1TLB9_EUMVA|nr:hypothetical protein EVAR_92388_1 [Eumeta japonica]